tara:strand:- start:177 stop:305 length:129 start_codon:yes stop_codon:yes gene_type:complete
MQLDAAAAAAAAAEERAAAERDAARLREDALEAQVRYPYPTP